MSAAAFCNNLFGARIASTADEMVLGVACTPFSSASALQFGRVREARDIRTRPALQIIARNRILLTPSEVQDSHTVRFGAHDDRAKHILQILKLEPGDELKVGIINGAMAQATVAQISPQVVLDCQPWMQPLPTAQLYLVLAMPRPKVMRRLWSTLACLGISRVYITGADKVEKAYFGARILEPRAFMKELIIGAEQAGDTRLPAVFFSRSLRTTIVSLAATFATDTATSHQSNAGQVQPLNSGPARSPSADVDPTLNSGQASALNSRQVQTLLAEGAKEWDVGHSNVSESAVQQQSDSMSCSDHAGRLTAPPSGSSGLLPHADANKSDAKTAVVVKDDGNYRVDSTAGVAAETRTAPSAAEATADGGNGSYADCTGTRVIKLLAHTEGGISVQQAVLSHFTHWHETESVADFPGGISELTGHHRFDELQVSSSQSSAPSHYPDGRLQHGRADRRPVAVLAVGPEGGWTPSEIALLTEEHAFQVVTTAGGRTLDTTTAIISLASLVSEAMTGCNDRQTS